MRRLTAWIGGAVGGITAYRLLRRRPEVAAGDAPAAPPEADERAEELRARLAETRAAEPVSEPVVEEPPAERSVEEPPEPESPEERRRRVHEEGRTTLDQMQSE